MIYEFRLIRGGLNEDPAERCTALSAEGWEFVAYHVHMNGGWHVLLRRPIEGARP